MIGKFVIISDLHVSAGRLDDFDGELQEHLLRFLETLSSDGAEIELVVNGDFLDFVQAPPWEGKELESASQIDDLPLCFTEEQSCQKLAAILEHHGPIFQGLRSFLQAKTGNRLVFLPGNHDADFFWPGVRRSLLDAICSNSGLLEKRTHFHLGRSYRPAEAPGLWVEHGHQFDEINSFQIGDVETWDQVNPPILTAQHGEKRLLECLGTRLLIQSINRLDADYPFVDNVKPFSLFVKVFAASALGGGKASLRAALAVWRMLGFLAKSGLTEPRSLLSVEGEDVSASEALASRIRTLGERTDELEQLVHNSEFEHDDELDFLLGDEALTEELLEFLASHPKLIEGLETDDEGYLDIDGGEGTLTLRKGFSHDESAELATGASRILDDPSVEMVVMGHTHEPRRRPAGIGYLNTGSWTRYYQRGAEAPSSSWSILKDGSEEHFPYELNYAEVDPRDPATARLVTFDRSLDAD